MAFFFSYLFICAYYNTSPSKTMSSIIISKYIHFYDPIETESNRKRNLNKNKNENEEKKKQML